MNLKVLLHQGTFMFMKYVVLWKLSSPEINLYPKRNLFLCLTPSFSQKVLGPILRLPETLFTFSTSGFMFRFLLDRNQNQNL